MAYLLATTWFLVEAFLIPEGLLKWFYLSFYIHPLLLILCQILLWVKLLVSWAKRVLAIPYGIVSFVASFLVTVFTGKVVDEPEDEVFVDAHGDMGLEEHSEASFGSYDLNMLRVMVVVRSKVNVVEEESGVVVTGLVIGLEEYMDEDATSVCSSQLTLSPGETADGKNIERDPFCEMDACMMTGEFDDLASVCSCGLTQILPGADDSKATKSEQDPFYRIYVQTMAWFDLLNHERTCGISAIFQAESKETAHRISSIWGDTAKKRLIRSLESDLELVYVAQTCLSWEILCYQQNKVEDLLMNTSPRRVTIQFDHIVIEELQRFQVLVERFTEDERFLDRCRYRRYIQVRASSKSLLQVPEIPGQVAEGEEEEEEVGVKLHEVLKAMEECIRAFHGFVKLDKDKEEISSSSSSSRWRLLLLLLKSCLFRRSWSSPPPVEDPRDLPLFSELISILFKKSLRLKDLQGKKKWGWRNKEMKTTYPTRTSQSGEQPPRKEKETMSLLLLFTEIDLELVARVLHMSTISTAHLTWCQAKLDNICFSHGKLSRAQIFPLFPSSFLYPHTHTHNSKGLPIYGSCTAR